MTDLRRAPDGGDHAEVVAAAVDRAAEAAARAGVEVRSLHDLGELRRARDLFDATWPLPGGGTVLEMNLLRALEHAGGYVSAAFDLAEPGADPVGAALAFPGRHRRGDGSWEEHLHSHMAAVTPAWQDRHVGTALKLHQRAWALRHGIPAVVWTFDPLVRRNVRVNLVKLGVRVPEYLVDFYGPMEDEVNLGDPSDRLLARWEVGSPRAAAAAGGGLAAWSRAPDDAVVVPLPADIVALRRADPAAATLWRLKVREAVLGAMGDGLEVVGVTTDGAMVLWHADAEEPG